MSLRSPARRCAGSRSLQSASQAFGVLPTLFMLSVLITSSACTDPPVVADFAAAQDDLGGALDRGERPAGDLSGMSSCLEDVDCPGDRWCDREEGSARGSCVLGCRFSPEDSCTARDDRLRCSPSERECYRSCTADRECPDDMWCALEEAGEEGAEGDGRCTPGCRLDDPEKMGTWVFTLDPLGHGRKWRQASKRTVNEVFSCSLASKR